MMGRRTFVARVVGPGARTEQVLPPGAENAVDCKTAKAMVWYLPYLGTPYDVARGSVGTVELGFASLDGARVFFDAACGSGHIEKAELRVDTEGMPRGRLVDDYTES
jgi:hypothetical protein